MAGKPANRSDIAREPAFAEDSVDEFASGQSGAQSPFGDELEFPLPVDQLPYVHPTAADRPNR